MTKIKQVNITRWLMTSFCGSILIFVLFGLFTIYDIHGVSRLTRVIYNHPLVVSNTAFKTIVSVEKMHRGTTDLADIYSLTRFNQALDEMRAEENRINRHLDVIKNRILGAEGRELARQAATLFDAWRPLREETVELVRQEKRAQAVALATGKGAEHAALLEAKMFAIARYASDKADEFMGESERIYAKFNKALIIFLVLGVLILVSAAFFIVRRTASAETALRASAARYRSLIETQTDLVSRFTPSGNFAYVNDVFCRFFDKTEADLIGKRWQPLPEGDDFEIVQAKLATLSPANPTVAVENRVRSGRGEIHWMHFVNTGIFDQKGNLVEIQSVGRDVTERRKAEEKIARFSRIYEDSLNEIYLFDAVTMKFTQVNSAALQNLGYTMEELQDMTPLDIKPDVTPETFADLIAPLRQKQKKKIVFETAHKRKNQTLYQVEVHLQLLEHENQEIFVAIILDITEKMKLEQQYRQAQKMESIGRLAGGVAHDYNNALSVIIGFTELAMGDVDPNHPIHDSLAEVLSAANRAKDITRQLLAFARRQTIAPMVLDLNRNVGGMLKMLRHLIGEDIDLAWLPGKGLWPVMLDPSQIDQILANLCVNARDAIQGVGKVTIETGNATFDEEYCAQHPGFIPGEYVLLVVSDDGAGMDKETLERVFEPFFTTKDVDKGTGLGLATVYGIVKQNEGFINIYSEPGKGTTIKIYFARYDAKVSEILSEEKAEVPKSQGETVLLVEDDPTILKLTRQLLAGLNYTVLSAGTPGKALELAASYTGPIHLLLTDVIMPESNGRELAERLQPQYPYLRCLYMSGYTANVIAHHGVLDEDVSFIQKPFSRKKLAKMVREALER